MANSLCERLPPPNHEPEFEQCVAISQGHRLNVAVRHAPPFVYESVNAITGEKKLEGIAVDFWEEVAQRLGVDYQYVCEGLSDTLDFLQKGTIDIAISPLTITKEREAAFDFSHQYFNSGLVFASIVSESNFDFSKAFNTLENTLVSKNILYLLAVFFVLLCSLVFFALKNISHYEAMPIMKNKNKPAIVLHVVLFSVLNISGIRKDVFGFSSVGMQLFSVLILVFGITVSASLFSMVTAALTQSVSSQDAFSIDTVDQYSVATLRGSTGQKFLCNSEKQPASLELTDTWQDALSRVANGEKDLVVGDWVQLVYLSQKPSLTNKITVYDQSFQFEPYGWGLKTNHPLRDVVNQELIGLLRHQMSDDIVKHYIGDQQINMQSQ